jgi:hypothetical protein
MVKFPSTGRKHPFLKLRYIIPHIADYYTFTVSRTIAVAAKNPENKEFFFKCILLWGFSLLESERYGSLELRKALRKEIVALS